MQLPLVTRCVRARTTTEHFPTIGRTEHFLTDGQCWVVRTDGTFLDGRKFVDRAAGIVCETYYFTSQFTNHDLQVDNNAVSFEAFRNDA